MNGLRTSPTARKRFPIELVMVTAALADFVGPPLLVASRSGMIAGFFFGAFAAQIGLLAIWAVLGPDRWAVRFPVTLAFAMLLFAMVFTGTTLAETGYFAWPESEAAMVFLVLPLLFLAAQSPLWILRAITGYRIVRAKLKEELSPAGSRQFHLRDLFLATTVVALVLGSAGLGLSEQGQASASVWGRLLLSCLVCAAWSAFSILPCLWAGLIARNTGIGVAVLGGYIVTAGIVLTLLGGSAKRSPAGEEIATLLVALVGLIGVMLAALHVARHWGYALGRAAREKPRLP